MVFEQLLLSTIQILIDNFKLLVLKCGILRTIHTYRVYAGRLVFKS
jgi:hypothetical protein